MVTAGGGIGEAVPDLGLVIFLFIRTDMCPPLNDCRSSCESDTLHTRSAGPLLTVECEERSSSDVVMLFSTVQLEKALPILCIHYRLEIQFFNGRFSFFLEVEKKEGVGG